MLTRLVFLASLVSTSTLLLTGAWPGSFDPPESPAETSFIAQSVPLDARVVGEGLDAKQLLRRACDAVAMKSVPWLRTRIRQAIDDGASHFSAEGFLQRGPNHCARLEMNIAKGDQPSRLIVVCDGEIIAQERSILDQEPKVILEKLPDDDVEDALVRKGCGGPSAVLAQMQQHLVNARLQTGALDGVAVIRIKGDIEPAAAAEMMAAATTPRSGVVYLNARTLWPERVEWCGADRNGTPRTILRIDFLDPELRRALSADECVRMFSYP